MEHRTREELVAATLASRQTCPACGATIYPQALIRPWGAVFGCGQCGACVPVTYRRMRADLGEPYDRIIRMPVAYIPDDPPRICGGGIVPNEADLIDFENNHPYDRIEPVYWME